MLLSVFVDLKKAFDTMSHDLVLMKFNQLGVTGIEYSWFESYLTGHSQYVDIDGCASSHKPIKVFVPQGSLLGVLIFQIFINDMPKSLQYCTSILYADDTTFFLWVNLSVSCILRFNMISINFVTGSI